MNNLITHYPQSRYIAPRVSAGKFTYNKATRTFSAEASDFGSRVPVGRLYDDACDEGLIIEGKTGAVPFYNERDERDAEGELVANHFVVCSEAVKRQPSLAGLRVVIFND